MDTPPAIICSAVTLATAGQNISIVCVPPSPTPTPMPPVTVTPTDSPSPIPTIAPTPIPTINPVSIISGCALSIMNGKPLPACVGETFFPSNLNGVYRKVIPSNTTADLNSKKMISSYFGTKGSGSDVVNGLMWHTNKNQSQYSYGRPVYIASNSDPQVNVHCTIYCKMGDATIRVPSRALAEGGSDNHLSVLQPDNTLADFWLWQGSPPYANGARINAGTIAISTVDGTKYSGNDILPAFMQSGVTAGGMVTPSGVITLAELQSGAIHHELYGVLFCTATNFYRPATQTARICTDGRTAIPNGALLQYIPDGVAIASSSMSAESKIIALAMHNYGVRIADTGGSIGLSIQVENQASFWSYGSGQDPFITYATTHGWNHIVNSSVDRFIHPLNDLDLSDNLRVLSSGN